jgi:hypothetical protein
MEKSKRFYYCIMCRITFHYWNGEIPKNDTVARTQEPLMPDYRSIYQVVAKVLHVFCVFYFAVHFLHICSGLCRQVIYHFEA